MTALREVFARFGVQFDSDELKKGDDATKGAIDRLRELGGVLAGGMVVQGIRTFAATSAAIGDELDKTSQVLGIGSTQLQAYRAAAEHAGVGADQLNNAFKTLARTATDAANRGGMREVFARIGVSATDAAEHVRPLTDLLPDIAANLNKLETPAERSAFLMQVMGESAGRLGPLFENGAEGLNEALGALEALGGGASEDFIAASARLTDAYADQDTALLSLRSRIGVLLLPVIERLVTAGTKLLTTFMDMTDGTHVLETAMGLLGAAATVAGLKIVSTFSKALLTFGSVAVGVGLLILLVDDLWTHFEGGRSVFGPIFEEFIEGLTASTAELATQDTLIGNLAFAWQEFARAIGMVVGLLPRLTNYLGLTNVAIDENALDPTDTIDNMLRDDRKTDPVLAARLQARASADAASGETRTPQQRVAEILSARTAAGPSAATGTRGGRRGGATLNSSPTVNIAVSGQGLDERQVADAAARAARREIDAANRDALEDLEGLAAS